MGAVRASNDALFRPLDFLLDHSSVEFDLLHKELEASIRGTNILGQRTKVGRAGDTVIDMSSALYYLRQNPPFELLAFFFDVSPRTYSRLRAENSRHHGCAL
jgi:hypothetical protein